MQAAQHLPAPTASSHTATLPTLWPHTTMTRIPGENRRQLLSSRPHTAPCSCGVLNRAPPGTSTLLAHGIPAGAASTKHFNGCERTRYRGVCSVVLLAPLTLFPCFGWKQVSRIPSKRQVLIYTQIEEG